MAVGTLGLHRRSINEACTLKVREYLAKSIPFIHSDIDVDLKSSQLNDFHIKISPGENSVNLNKVIKKIKKIYSSKKLSLMREFAEKNLDIKIKMKELQNYIENLG